jgi:subtilisin family serine protease
MKFVGLLLTLLCIAVLINVPKITQPSSAQSPVMEHSIAGELLIKFKNETSRGELTTFHNRLGASIKKEFSSIRWQHIQLPPGLTAENAIEVYKHNPNVELVQPNFIYRLSTTPDDTRFSELYGMQKISAPAAWDSTTGSDSVVVAVIDTGINYNHEDLAANVWINPGEIAANGVDDDLNGYVDDIHGIDTVFLDSDPADDHSHGSHCAGTIGGVGNNGKGVAGVNWNVRLMSVKTHDGVAGASTSVRVITAFEYVKLMKNRGVNIRATSNSYGGAPEAASYDQALKDAIDAAGRADILNLFAAGNDDFDNDLTPTYPSSYNSPSIMAVAASDRNDAKASFSSYGATAVDVAAPGVNILSTVLGQSYGSKSGTSMATPHTAGAAALLAAAHPNLSAASIKATLMNTVDVLPQWSGVVLSSGRINVANAIANPTICSYALSSHASSYLVQGGNSSFDVTSNINCGFAAFSDQPWVVVTSSPGAGNGSVQFTVAPNYSLESRTATLVIAGRLHTITQAGTGPVVLSATVSGRVITPDGKGINKAVVTMVDSATGSTRQTFTSPTGFYRFENVAAGRSYTLTAEQRRFEFEQRSLILIGNAENVDFVGRNK